MNTGTEIFSNRYRKVDKISVKHITFLLLV